MKPEILLEVELPGGWPWSHIVKRGTALTLTARDEGINVGMIAYAAWNFFERYNMADTLKAQHISRLSAGNVLYSDMGRVLLSVVADSLDGHDTIGGMLNPRRARAKYGLKRYQEHRNDSVRDAYTTFLTEIGKYGMTPTALIGNVNWFSRVDVAADGQMRFVPSYASVGDSVELRAEMDTLVVLNTCPHPLDPSPDYRPGRLGVQIARTDAPGPHDRCRTSCEENRRGFVNTERWHV